MVCLVGSQHGDNVRGRLSAATLCGAWAPLEPCSHTRSGSEGKLSLFSYSSTIIMCSHIDENILSTPEIIREGFFLDVSLCGWFFRVKHVYLIHQSFLYEAPKETCWWNKHGMWRIVLFFVNAKFLGVMQNFLQANKLTFSSQLMSLKVISKIK